MEARPPLGRTKVWGGDTCRGGVPRTADRAPLRGRRAVARPRSQTSQAPRPPLTLATLSLLLRQFRSWVPYRGRGASRFAPATLTRSGGPEVPRNSGMKFWCSARWPFHCVFVSLSEMNMRQNKRLRREPRLTPSTRRSTITGSGEPPPNRAATSRRVGYLRRSVTATWYMSSGVTWTSRSSKRSLQRSFTKGRLITQSP